MSRFGLFSVQCFKRLLHFGRFGARLKAVQAVEAFDAVLALVLRPEDAELWHIDRLFFKQEPYFPGDVKRNTIPPRGAHFASDIKRLAQPRGGGDVLTVLHVEQREVRQRDRHLAVFMEGLIELLGVREQLARDLRMYDTSCR